MDKITTKLFAFIRYRLSEIVFSYLENTRFNKVPLVLGTSLSFSVSYSVVVVLFVQQISVWAFICTLPLCRYTILKILAITVI